MRRAASAVVVVLAVVLTCVPGAIAAPTVSGSFAVSDTPYKLTAGPDGNMWVVVGGVPSKLARVKPDGTVNEFDLTGINDAKGVTAGPDGNLWVTAGATLVRVPPANPAGQKTFAVLDITDPRGITTGPDGNLWTASGDKVLRIPPATPTAGTTFTVSGMSARDIASSGGLLWVADFTGRIVSLTPAGVQTPYTVGGGPQAIGAGSGGQVLFANPGAVPQTVGRLVAGGTPLTTERPMFDPFGIALGADGAYWVAEFAAGDLLRITPDGAVTTLPGVGVANDPREIAAGPGNTLWVSLEQSKQVARVTGVEPPVVPPVTTPGPVTPVVVTPPADTTAPVLSRLRISPARFRRRTGALGRLATTKPAARVTLTLSEAATVTFAAQRLLGGRRVGGTCVATTHRNRARAGCQRVAAAGGTVSLALPVGENKLGFSGWLARALVPGSYRLVTVARDAAGNASGAARAAFTILAPRR